MLSNLNSIILEGNLTKDPEFKRLNNNVELTTFSVAVNHYYKKDDQIENDVSYFQIETWSRLAVSCIENLQKGRGVRVVGRLRQNRWVDATGKNQSKVLIVAEHVEFKPKTNRLIDAEKTIRDQGEYDDNEVEQPTDTTEEELVIP